LIALLDSRTCTHIGQKRNFLGNFVLKYNIAYLKIIPLKGKTDWESRVGGGNRGGGGGGF
jgi:hypothetical protein